MAQINPLPIKLEAYTRKRSKWIYNLFFIIGVLFSIYFLAGLRVYREFGATDFNSDSTWYYSSGLKLEHRWLSSGRGFTMNEIKKEEYLKHCSEFEYSEKDYLFYNENCH